MDRLATMQLFLRVAESGSFSKAAHSTGVNQPTASKQIAALETRLGAQLLRRTSRGLTLTEAGQDFYESALRIIEDVEQAESRIGRGQSAPAGHVRVAISAGLARMHIIPRLPEFFGRFPDVTLDFDVSERHVNLAEDGIDVAIRIGALADSSLVARRIGNVEAVAIATPDYLERRGTPRTPSELEAHDCVVFLKRDAPRPWQFKDPGGPVSWVPKGRIRSNDAEHLRAAVLAGLGIGYNVSWLFAPELESGTVVQVLKEYTPDPYPINAVRSAGRRVPSKVKVLIDFFAEAFAQHPHLRMR